MDPLDIIYQVLLPATLATAIGALFGYSRKTLNLDDSEKQRLSRLEGRIKEEYSKIKDFPASKGTMLQKKQEDFRETLTLLESMEYKTSKSVKPIELGHIYDISIKYQLEKYDDFGYPLEER